MAPFEWKGFGWDRWRVSSDGLKEDKSYGQTSVSWSVGSKRKLGREKNIWQMPEDAAGARGDE